jgi:hypothetical protein
MPNAAHYVHCQWPRLSQTAHSIGNYTRISDDPLVAHMSGQECPVFMPKFDEGA